MSGITSPGGLQGTMKNIQLIVNKVLDLLAEVEMYSFYKTNLRRQLAKLFADYQAGIYDYFTYEKRLKKLLKGKTEDEMINYYNSYILSLLKRIETYNSEIFYEAYQDKRYVGIDMLPEEARLSSVPTPSEEEITAVPRPKEIEMEKARLPAVKQKGELGAATEISDLSTETPVAAKMAEPKLVDVKPTLFERFGAFFRNIFVKRKVEKTIETIKPLVKADVKGKGKGKSKGKSKGNVHVQAKKGGLFDVAWSAPHEKARIDDKKKKKTSSKPGAVALGGGFGIGWFKNLFTRKKVDYSEKESEVQLSTLQMEGLRRRSQPEITAQLEKITATALTREAKRIKDIMEKRKALKIYHPSFFGSLANLTIRKISLFLLDNFPDFFKDLYHALRLANIKVLSNTYVNMMVLGVVVSTLLGLLFFGFFFASTPLPLLQVIFRTVMMAILLGLVSFAGFYAYPYSVMKQRRRSINTNLPFAINHMAAVSGSGVSPTKMFKLISQSKEYGEISVEIEKIVNYVAIFGYDVLTSLKAVAAQTPSYQFKDFFEGMISTTQSGGDISSYLSQKADEAMLNYKLERKKYTETISTYSDIYTGILIAAPLFFVAALSLVSLLGGKIGGINVNVIIVLGTYVVIPSLNIAFMTFLEMTQPEV